MKANDIKKAIQNKRAEKKKPTEEIEIVGVKGFLYKSSSYEMEGWRSYSNATTDDGKSDENKRRLSPAKLIQISFRDEDGTKVFEELDLPFIGGIEDAEINRVFKRCLAINGYGGEGIEAILKNLLAIVGEDGLFASLVNIGCRCPNCSKSTQPTNSESNGSASNTGPQDRHQKATKPSLQEK